MHGMNTASGKMLLRVGLEGYAISGGWSPAVAAADPILVHQSPMELLMGNKQDQGNKGGSSGSQQGGSSQGGRNQSGGSQDQSRQSSQGGGSGDQGRQQSGESQRGGQ